MKVSSIFASQYLRASDLPAGRDVHVVIERVEPKAFDDGDKLIVSFFGKQKSWVCGKTSAEVLAASLGDETDAWQGAQITLFVTKVSFGGRLVDAVRCRVQSRKQQAEAPSDFERGAPPPSPPPGEPLQPNGGLDDEIPF
jgi:hypothetical protein